MYNNLNHRLVDGIVEGVTAVTSMNNRVNIALFDLTY